MVNLPGRLDSANGVSPEMAPFNRNPADFPALNSVNSSESLPESTPSKTQPFHNAKSFSEIVGSHLPNRGNNCKFFLAD
ncbi:UNVERIFIED_CONTAM: hypothetical protein Sangu_3159300 [Sesamum angustifolium]|uniref:Uncharacterized protein n=1 Tax=Sesamum angustifolium TaxID=2727405 RepID=A0AAW2JWS3_9LAMI